MNGLDNQIITISEDQLDSLFSDTPSDITPTADTLPVTVDPGKVDSNNVDIPVVDVDDVFNPKDDDASKKKDNPVDKDKSPLDVNADKDKNKDKDPKDTDAAKAPASAEVLEVLKNTVDHLIEAGLWDDFNRDEFEFTEENYAQLAELQAQRKVESLFGELLDSTGVYGKAIISHLRQGGNPDDVIDIFKEQKQVEAIDTTTEDGQMELVHRYYSEIVGWKPEKIKKHLQSLIENKDDMKEEVSDISEKYNEYYQEQLDALDQENRARQVVEARKQQVFSQNINKAINERSDLNDRQKRYLESSILNFRNELPDGRRVNDFYMNFAKMQSDPKLYIDLVEFVMDKEAYETRIKTVAENKAAVKTFNFVKNGAASNRKGTSDTPEPTSSSSSKNGTDFSNLFKPRK